MVDEHVQALIHAELDGELSPAGQAELAETLLANPEARAFRDALVRTHRALQELAPAEPPAGLRSRILDELTVSPRAESVAGSAQGPRGATLFRYAAVFVAGVALAAIAFQLRNIQDVATDPRNLAGTMVDLPGDATLVDQAQIDAPGLSGALRLLRAGTDVVLEAEFSAAAATEIEILYDPARLDIAATPAAPMRLARGEKGAERLLIAAGPGQQVQRFGFEARAGEPVRLDVALRSGSGETVRRSLNAHGVP